MVDQRNIVSFIPLFLLLWLKLFHFELTLEQQVQQLSSPAERAALLQLRSSLGLRSKEWPRKADPCSNWIGVRCQNGRVVGINISGFRRTRIGRRNPQFSVEALANLTLLQSFNASNFRLPGPIPDWFGQKLHSLRVLDLRSCFITGVIPPGVGNLTNLTSLYLSDNNLTGVLPNSLGQLSVLSVLDLSKNFINGSLPTWFASLGNLSSLDISANHLSGSIPPGIGTLSKLQFLVLRQNNFTGALPVELWSLPQLSFLDVSSNNFTGQLPNSSSIANATVGQLNISHNMFYGGLTTILRRFSSVDLSGNYFEGNVLDFMVNASIGRNCLRNVTGQRTLAECASFYAARGLAFDNFGRPNSTGDSAGKASGMSNKTKILIAAISGGVGLFVLLLLLILLLLCIRKRGNSSQRGNGVGPAPAGGSPPHPGAGSSIKFSSVGDSFKRIDIRSTQKDAYLSELDFFNKVSHPRFVPLLGHCLETENEKFLIYKAMPNGDLSSCLHYKKTVSEDDKLKSLDWITRLKIATGAAEALAYLHHECNPPIVHRDVQASSILLEDKYEVRLGSLSEACPQDGDTQQSKITRLLRLPQSSEQGTSGSSTSVCAYDVYCFGKVLLELVTGKLGISAASDAEAKEWLEQILPCITIYDKERITKIVDPSLIVDDEDLLEEVWAVAIVARTCLNPKPSRRPQMRHVLRALENPFKVVREENSSSARLRSTSSRGSWNATLFGSWRQSSSDVAVIPAASSTRIERESSLKHSGTTGSEISLQNVGGDMSSISPEPSGVEGLKS
ncbi:probable LRR receptor-like serine/threonine-protein kinase At2g16250 [Arachis duranensis]|uniref:Probable LRR receptor-like serine/threonine-protein kinase At2g16250 n=1 Tax=Arachis duranensis TaxID=130453 RepID=A0A6P4CJI0_ARADU|nr:probable LRR receptor-like serine/threonine-protein kinase At2g16250 [Arachis duranensis]XP_052115335.1 probable LRR receptor-like serine/threonine-protein kinase At2g16250 [Arachis duranensis]